MQSMEVVGDKDSFSSLCHSSSGQKIERALAIKVEDVRPWGVGSKFSAAYADVSGSEVPLGWSLGRLRCLMHCMDHSQPACIASCRERTSVCWWLWVLEVLFSRGVQCHMKGV